jgi:hypothetical protein
MWSKESFYTSRISRNSLDPEMLMGGWDTLYINKTLFSADKIIDIHPTVQYTDDKHINTMDSRTTGTQYLEG